MVRGLGAFDHRRLVDLAAAATERLQAELRELLRVDAVALAHREPQHRRQTLTFDDQRPHLLRATPAMGRKRQKLAQLSLRWVSGSLRRSVGSFRRAVGSWRRLAALQAAAFLFALARFLVATGQRKLG